MPSEYGAISKAYIEKPKLTDNQVSTIETLNLFCLGFNITRLFHFTIKYFKEKFKNLP